MRYAGLLADEALAELRHLSLRKIKAAHIRAAIDKAQQRGLAARTVVQLRAVMAAS